MKRRGLSLVEVLIVCALLVLVFGLIHQILSQIMRSSTRVRVAGQLQQSATAAMLQVQRLVQEVNAASLSLPSQPPPPGQPYVCAFHQVVGASDEGRPIYETARLVGLIFEPGSGRLLRREVTPGALGLSLSAEIPTRLTDVQLQALATANGSDHLLVVQVKKFSLSCPSAPPGQVTVPLALELELSQSAVAGNPPESFRCQPTLVLRNTL